MRFSPTPENAAAEPASAETAAIAGDVYFRSAIRCAERLMGSRPKDNDSLVMYDRMLLWLTFGRRRSALLW